MSEIIDGEEAIGEPSDHAGNHTDGTDDIQSATNAQKGLATAAQITALEAAAAFASFPGFLIRPRFIHKDADEIYIDPGVYHHQGTAEQFVYWDSQLTVQLSGAGADTWYYLYLDDSAIVTLGLNLLTASEFIFSDTAPTYDVAKHGFYNGLDRCIFANLTDGSNNILPHYHDGGDLAMFADYLTSLALTDIDAAWVDVTHDAPSFATKILVSFEHDYNAGSGVSGYWRTNGQSGTLGHKILRSAGSSTRQVNTSTVISDSGQIIEVKYSAADSNHMGVYTDGFFLPGGM